MKRYTIYCTEEQTRKALELGAPIVSQEYCPVGGLDNDWFAKGRLCFRKPTAEQMIGWLGTQGLCIDVEWSWNGQSTMWVWDNTKKEHVYTSYGNSHEKTTLAAIDAALEQLMKAKEEKK